VRLGVSECGEVIRVWIVALSPEREMGKRYQFGEGREIKKKKDQMRLALARERERGDF
jgi:hypothetical protein